MNLLLRQLAVLAVLAFPVVYTHTVDAADPKLVEAAKKEAMLVAYFSMLTENATALLAEFKKKYPFIETSLYRANKQRLLPKIKLEARTHQNTDDIINAKIQI